MAILPVRQKNRILGMFTQQLIYGNHYLCNKLIILNKTLYGNYRTNIVLFE